ncbi:MAG: hypothetical protein HY905_19530 [Deltaproteobacteria bacterium]|nr:hypothetical protein [Deltaproteobacteria bacterium]
MGVLACLGTFGNMANADLSRLITESAMHPNRTAASIDQVIRGAMPRSIALNPRHEARGTPTSIHALEASARLDAARQQWSRGFQARVTAMKSVLSRAPASDRPTPKTNDGD